MIKCACAKFIDHIKFYLIVKYLDATCGFRKHIELYFAGEFIKFLGFNAIVGNFDF
jgi:hypothetical protein